MSSALLAASLARLLVDVGIKVVVMHMLGSVLAMGCVGDCVESAIGDKVPAGLTLVCEHEVAAVVPAEESVHLLRKVEDLIRWLLVHPVVQGAVELITAVSGDLLRELTLKAGEDVIELESVRGEMNPLGSSGEESQSIARPETV